MAGLVLGVTVEPWARDVLIVAFSIGLVFAVVIGGLFAIAKAGARVADELTATVEAVKELEGRVRELQDGTIPAFASFLGTVGVAVSGLVSPIAGIVFAFVCAAATFVFASLAKDPNSGPFRRWLAVIAAMAPFVGSTIGVFVSGHFASLSLSMQIAIAVGLVIGVAGLTGIVIRQTKQQISLAPPSSA
jgi:amino acid transporter